MTPLFAPPSPPSVADLKHAIHSKYKIAVQHQVLVVNGGECMAAERRVCTYSAGTVRVAPGPGSSVLESKACLPPVSRPGCTFGVLQRFTSVAFVFVSLQDTNPIFLFNKEMILCDRPPAIPKTTFSTENDMEIKVEESLMMPAVFHTVASRTQLAVVR